jgi:hypothetical protein
MARGKSSDYDNYIKAVFSIQYFFIGIFNNKFDATIRYLNECANYALFFTTIRKRTVFSRKLRLPAA